VFVVAPDPAVTGKKEPVAESDESNCRVMPVTPDVPPVTVIVAVEPGQIL
jgi:hypothetical protein